MNRKPKILLWDIETSKMLVQTFSLYDNYIDPSNIVEDWTIIGGAWKWLGEDEVYTSYVSPRSPRKDKRVVKDLRKALSQADMIIGHNGDKFDLKKFQARAIFHGLDPLPPIPSVDTLKVAKKHFKFTSNRLDYIARILCGHGKLTTPKGMWEDVMRGDPIALEMMRDYNIVDVEILEDVYLKLRPWMTTHPNLNLMQETSLACPICGGLDLKVHKHRMSRVGMKTQYQCQSCGGYCTDKSTVHSSEMR